MPGEQLTADTVEHVLKRLARRDPTVRRALRRLGCPQYRKRPLNFQNLLRIIVGQQLSGKAADTIFRRVEARLAGDRQPQALLALSDAALRDCGLSRQKAAAARSLAQVIVEGSLKLGRLHRLADEAVVEDLVQVKGMGAWSAHMALIFLLGRPDVWPTGDLGVRVGVGRLLGLRERPDAQETEALGEPWRPQRTVMALLAWRAANAAE